jgi:hypothetical protein
VAPPRVVERLDEIEDRQAGLIAVLEHAAVDELALEGGEEALRQGVVIPVADRAHRPFDPGSLARLGEVVAGALGGFNRSSQHLDAEVCPWDDDRLGYKRDWQAADAVTGATTGLAS